jgi:hypothetical protein
MVAVEGDFGSGSATTRSVVNSRGHDQARVEDIGLKHYSMDVTFVSGNYIEQLSTNGRDSSQYCLQ